MNNHSTLSPAVLRHATAGRRISPLRRGAVGLVAAGFALATLAGCGTSGEAADASGSPAASQSDTSAGDLQFTDGWAKAADSNMTAIFGTLKNTTDHDVTVASAEAKDVAGMTQLHETVMDEKTGSMQMQEKKDGFTIAAGQSIELKPGGDHIMLMKLKCSLKAGTDVGFEVTVKDGATQHFSVPVRDYQGAQEHYAPGEEGAKHEGHEGHGDSAGAESSQGAGHGEHSGEKKAEGGEHSAGGHDMAGHGEASASPLPACHEH